MKKVSVIGLFCNGIDVADGQSIKTRIVADELERALGRDQVARIDTYGWKKHPFRLFQRCASAVIDSYNVVFLTDAGGVKVFPWLLSCLNIFTRRSIHYLVVGGWLVRYIRNHPILGFFMKRLNGVYVETTALKEGLEDLGFENLHLMPNFKRLNLIQEAQLACPTVEPFRFCTFSRVMREKGIETAISAVQKVNETYGRTICTLDIFGQVDPNQTQWFEQLTSSFPEYVRYCGVVPYDNSVETIKGYFALLFPTEFFTEGIPGTIIDAYAAGVPVIASKWESFADIIDDEITGIGYSFDYSELLSEVLFDVIEKPEIIYKMKNNCLEKARKYLPEKVIEILLLRLG